MRRLRDLMTYSSKLRYLLWRGMDVRSETTVALGGGERLVLRPPPAHDLGTARDVFVEQIYRSPRQLEKASVRNIVDVGANVGYSIVYFLHAYPNAFIKAFEPHPVHCRQIERHLVMNRDATRVMLYQAAAGTKEGKGWLTEAGVGSHLIPTQSGAELAVGVEILDFFDCVKGQIIDLLKCDCEGSEYDLLMDDRFAALDVLSLVMEWHATAAHPNAQRDLIERLDRLGFAVESTSYYGIPQPEFGLLANGIVWGYKNGKSN
jgi:FkbM family methyltransferase